ncbi:hypothetical protein [Micromonospora sp. WMMD737]|uniref:hypothetical protein n=1 Tax=Micromonospora sp. WMMD737 TaxID=3404113 RepID=UPI003B922C04
MSENAQQRDDDRTGGRSGRRDGEAEAARRGGENEPDVLLDIPEVSVDSIRLAVDGLDADVSLRARLADLLQLDAGVRVHLEGVELDITGVHAEALLKVRLEKLVQILDRALTTIDRNPQVIQTLSDTAAASMDDVNRASQQLANLSGQLTGPGERGRAEPLTALGEQPPLERVGGATDDLGQQVGAIGAVADQSLREPGGPGRGGKPGTGRGGEPGGRGQGGEPGGRGQGGELGAEQAQRGGGLASGSGGGGEQGQAQRAREQEGDEAARREPGGPEERERGQGTPEQGGQRPGGSPQGGGAERSGQGRGRAEQGAQQPGGERVGGPGGGTAGAGGGDRGAGGSGGGLEAGQREPSGGPSEGGQGRQRPETSGGGGGDGGAPSAAQIAEQAGETLRQAGRSVWEAIQGGIAQHRQQR